ncbi:iron-containing alcohol dehydrogenase [Planococcus lenghuensis]|uniref:Alcohol dehydrogenase n=1 Tax=Planococcus lenghuensis TaxID=2213202 RepID=A0A1Q2L329_9BACL|nr:iron-containing alcohol dehydrogenase [Planococcus lenghuensis]AQQ54774.1 alcohol dehydrogenase [Planococcus lenghuensis]
MESYSVFRSPQTIKYGRGSFEEAGKEAARKGKKVLIVSDQVMDKLGNVSACIQLLREEGLESAVYLGVETEPTDVFVAEALEVFRQEKCDTIISLGGGSCIDTAKAAAVLATNGGYIGDYMGGRKMASSAPIPHIAIPTTAGTGSEATDATIITNTSNDVKMMIKQPAFLPEVAIVDPLLALSAPKHVTAATGIDALSHAIEAYISRLAHPMTDVMALSAMKLIVGNLLTVYEDENKENLEAREKLALGSMQAGLAFSNASVALVHGMSRPIGALFHVPHGFSNAMLLPAVLEFSKEHALGRLADLGKIFDPEAQNYPDEQAAAVAVASVKNLCLKLNIPNLGGWGIEREKFSGLVSKMAADALISGSPGNNPRVPTQQEIEDLYHICYSYDFSPEASAT